MARPLNKSAAIRLLLRSDPDLAPQQIIDRLAAVKVSVTKDQVKATRLRMRRGSKTHKLTAAEIELCIRAGRRFPGVPTFEDAPSRSPKSLPSWTA